MYSFFDNYFTCHIFALVYICWGGCLCVHTTICLWRSQDILVRVDSCLPPYGSWASESGHQAWSRTPSYLLSHPGSPDPSDWYFVIHSVVAFRAAHWGWGTHVSVHWVCFRAYWKVMLKALLRLHVEWRDPDCRRHLKWLRQMRRVACCQR